MHTTRGRRAGAVLALMGAVASSVYRDVRRAGAAVRLDAPASTVDLDVVPSGHDTGARYELIALGDSSIAGVGATDLHGCLAVQVAARVADALGAVVHVRGYGVSGARTGDVATMQVPAVEPPTGPAAILVVVGMNDIVHLTSPVAYARAVAALHSTVRARFSVPVIACSLPEVRAITIVGHPLRDVAAAYGRMLGMIQRRVLRGLPGVTWVDARRAAGPAFLQRPETASEDGFHPSAIGYGLLADVLAPAVADALQGGVSSASAGT